MFGLDMVRLLQELGLELYVPRLSSLGDKKTYDVWKQFVFEYTIQKSNKFILK